MLRNTTYRCLILISICLEVSLDSIFLKRILLCVLVVSFSRQFIQLFLEPFQQQIALNTLCQLILDRGELLSLKKIAELLSSGHQCLVHLHTLRQFIW